MSLKKMLRNQRLERGYRDPKRVNDDRVAVIPPPRGETLKELCDRGQRLADERMPEDGPVTAGD